MNAQGLGDATTGENVEDDEIQQEEGEYHTQDDSLPEGKRCWAASVLKRKKSLKYHDIGRFYARDVKVLKRI